MSDGDAPSGVFVRFDARRRDAILGVRALPAQESTSTFDALDLVGLARLLREGFVDPDDRRGASPTALEALAFLARWPEVRLHGYALHPLAPETAVVLEGYRCDLDLVDPARRELLREAFAIECGGADEYVDDDWLLFAAWS